MNKEVLIFILLAVCFACIAAELVIIIILQKKVKDQDERTNAFFSGGTGEDFEAMIDDKLKKLQILEEKDVAEDLAIRDIYSKIGVSYQKFGLVEYDAFDENGGNLSFALTVLDGENNGFILNVMNSHEGSYCYVKEIIDGQCDKNLGNEEAQSLDMAIYNK